MNLKGFISKALAVIMCVSMLTALVVGSTGCNFINNITDGLNVASNNLSEAELARLVVNAIISEKNVGDSYEKIPKSQLDGLSYSMFSEYCSILRKHSQIHGNVDSFRILNDVEKYKYFDSILSDYETDIQTLEGYGEMDVIEICYSEDKAPGVSPVRFVIGNINGKYIMPSEYINDSMLAYSYITHYFDMIDDALWGCGDPVRIPKSLLANYLSELRLGDEFTLSEYRDGDTVWFEGTGEKPYFRVKITY